MEANASSVVKFFSISVNNSFFFSDVNSLFFSSDLGWHSIRYLGIGLWIIFGELTFKSNLWFSGPYDLWTAGRGWCNFITKLDLLGLSRSSWGLHYFFLPKKTLSPTGLRLRVCYQCMIQLSLNCLIHFYKSFRQALNYALVRVALWYVTEKFAINLVCSASAYY